MLEVDGADRVGMVLRRLICWRLMELTELGWY